MEVKLGLVELKCLLCFAFSTKQKKGAINVVTSGGGENNNYEMEEVVRRVCVQSRAGRGG